MQAPSKFFGYMSAASTRVSDLPLNARDRAISQAKGGLLHLCMAIHMSTPHQISTEITFSNRRTNELLRAPELCISGLRPGHTSACSLAKLEMARDCVSKPGIEPCKSAFSCPVSSKQCRRTCPFLSETTVTITGIPSFSCPRPVARQGPRRSMTACYAIYSARRCRTLLEADDWRGEC